MTRARFADDMVSVGVPPSDVYDLLKTTSSEDEALWKSALASMIKVNESFKIRGNDILSYRGRDNQWSSWQDVLQGNQS
eukprot:7004894-Karenia_brevis.AAC.1